MRRETFKENLEGLKAANLSKTLFQYKNIQYKNIQYKNIQYKNIQHKNIS